MIDKRVTLYYREKYCPCIARDIHIDEEYHTPKCLVAIARALKAVNEDFVMLLSEKYGCRQFRP